MKKVSLFIFFVILVSIAIGSLLFLTTGNFSFIISDKPAAETTKEQTINLNSTDEVYIKTSSVDINVGASDIGFPAGDKNYGNINLVSNGCSVSSYKDGNKTYITVSPASHKNFFFGFWESAKLDIILPMSFSNKLSVESSSGNLLLSNMTISKLNSTSSSGNLTLKDLSSTTLVCSSTSGTINGTAITTIDSSFNSSSGNISLKTFSGNVVANASSGNIKIGYTEFNNNLSANSSSGNIKVTLSKNSEFALDAASSSGNINCSFPIEVTDIHKKNILKGIIKETANKIYIRTSSGDVGINY